MFFWNIVHVPQIGWRYAAVGVGEDLSQNLATWLAVPVGDVGHSFAFLADHRCEGGDR